MDTNKGRGKFVGGDGESNGIENVCLSLRYHISNDALRQMSGVKDVMIAIWERKLRWAGHVTRL